MTYPCNPKIQLRRNLRCKPILLLSTCQRKHLLIFLTACYLAYNWMTYIIILRLASLDSRLGFVHILFRFFLLHIHMNQWEVYVYIIYIYIYACSQVKVSMAGRHAKISTLIKLDASIVFGLCIFLDEPMLKQLEVLFLKNRQLLLWFWCSGSFYIHRNAYRRWFGGVYYTLIFFRIYCFDLSVNVLFGSIVLAGCFYCALCRYLFFSDNVQRYC
jgi:hypothetical protein